MLGSSAAHGLYAAFPAAIRAPSQQNLKYKDRIEMWLIINFECGAALQLTSTSMQSPLGISSKRKYRCWESLKLANCLKQKGCASMLRLMCCSSYKCLHIL